MLFPQRGRQEVAGEFKCPYLDTWRAKAGQFHMGAKASIYFYACSLNNKMFEQSPFSECHEIMFVNNDLFLFGLNFRL